MHWKHYFFATYNAGIHPCFRLLQYYLLSSSPKCPCGTMKWISSFKWTDLMQLTFSPNDKRFPCINFRHGQYVNVLLPTKSVANQNIKLHCKTKENNKNKNSTEVPCRPEQTQHLHTACNLPVLCQPLPIKLWIFQTHNTLSDPFSEWVM